MTNLTSLLHSVNVRSAVIIDDAYEQVPVAGDLLHENDIWGRFFEDVNATDAVSLKGIFPTYDQLRADELTGNNEFLIALWSNQKILRKELIDPFFENFKREKAQDLAYLEILSKCLQENEIPFKQLGRNFQKEAIDADLILIDLYLCANQDDDAMASSMNGLKEVISKRRANPPIVVLMSRSARLEEKRQEFRDNSGLFESAFRIIRKTELAEEGKLARLLTRLAEHYADSTKLAVFLDAWQAGLERACGRTANLIRTLDLADHAQIRQLLLTEEGEPPGSYLVDVFDLVLQHEIEREASIIDAAIDLNGLDSETYPPPYVAGSPDLQALVYRSLFHHNGRLRLTKPNSSAAAFGDMLRRKSIPAGAAPDAQANNSEFLKGIGADDVLIVMTPACDLQRQLAKRILLLKGTLVPLTPANWSYEETPIRTPVFETAANTRFQVRWDLKHVETVSNDDLKKLLAAPGGFDIVARLREAPTLELQQKLLSNLGRIGLIAPMPATFAVNVEVYLPDVNKKLFKLDVPALANSKGVCFVGRNKDKEARRLVLSEDACEAVCETLQAINPDLVHPTTRPVVLELRGSGNLLLLQKGVDYSGVTDKSYKEIFLVVPATLENPAEKRVIGLIRGKGDWVDQENLNGGYLGKAGIILVVSESE